MLLVWWTMMDDAKFLKAELEIQLPGSCVTLSITSRKKQKSVHSINAPIISKPAASLTV
jgi:hypothetical protein